MVKLLKKNPYKANTFIADTIFWHRMKSSNQIYLFIVPIFFVGK